MNTPLPASFLLSLQQVAGFSEQDFLLAHEADHVSSVRINPFKYNQAETPFHSTQKIPWSSYGYYLEERPSFTLDPLFHAGAYYVQEASSMFLEQALRQQFSPEDELKVLDLCAAPGGKSTLLQSFLSANSLLLSNEVIKSRVGILAENIIKWGAANVVVTNNDPKDFQRLPGFFDVIVVDAPCSGSGLFRKDANAVKEWNPQLVQLCSQRQQRILADVLPTLKENGLLIYSTCSYSAEEDENVADWLLENCKLEPVPIALQPAWGIVETISAKYRCYGYRFYPDKLKGEGFFMSVFRKKDTPEALRKSGAKKNISPASKDETTLLKNYIDGSENYRYIKLGEDILAFPQHHAEMLPLFQESLYIKKAGVRLGSVNRGELIPHHEFALSCIISDAFPFVELDKDSALNYLRKTEIGKFFSGSGWSMVKYKGLSLGFIKILSSRINNYYPKEWRILNK